MAEDFLAQVRSLNPDLAGYDDQTLAAAIGDQHPDYKPKLAKYFPDTATVAPPATAASAAQDVTADESVDGKEAARLEFAKAHEDISPWAAAEKGAAYLGSEPVRQQIKTLPWGVRGAANVGAAAGQFALEQATPENAVLAASLPILPAAGARAATGLFAGTALYDTIKRVPGLWELYKKGDWDNFEREATKAGLGGLIAAGLTKHAIKGRAAMEVEDQAADLKAKQKVAEVLGTSEAQADVAKQQEVVDALNAATIAPNTGGPRTPAAEYSPSDIEASYRGMTNVRRLQKALVDAGQQGQAARLQQFIDYAPYEHAGPPTVMDRYVDEYRQSLGQELLTPEQAAEHAKRFSLPVLDEMRPKELPETVGAAPPIVPGAKAAPSAPLSTEPIPEMTPEQIAAAEVGPETPSVRARAAAGGYSLGPDVPNGEGRTRFPIFQNGKDTGLVVDVREMGPILDVDWVGLAGGSRERIPIGPSAVRDLGRQLLEKFPETERITGSRVTGAKPDYTDVRIDAEKFRQPEVVQGANGEKVIPNDRPAPERTAGLEAQMAQDGIDPKDHDAVAAYLTKLYDLKKPMVVESVGETPVSVANETPDAYPIELAGKGPPADELSHEVQHPRQVEGQIPAVPEGPGANDTIVDQVTQDTQKYAGNLNLNRLDISPEAKQGIIDNVASVERQKPIPLEETLKAAKEIGMSYDEATALASGTSDLHAQVTAARQLESHAATQFQAAKAGGDPKAANAALDNLISAMQSSSDVAANVGRALGSFNIKAEAVEPAAEFGKLLAELQKKGKKTTDLRQKLMETNLEDPVQRGKLRTAMKSRGAGWMQKVEEYYVNSILSGLPTMGKKFISDLLIGLHAPIEILASYPPRMALYLAGKGEKPYLGEAPARTLGFFSGLNDGMRAFTNTMKGQSAHFTPEPAIEGVKGTIVRTSTRALSAITDFVRAMEVRASLYKQGYTAAAKKGASYSEAMDGAKHSVDNPDKTTLTKAHEDAADRVLMSPPGKFTSSLYGMRRATPFGRLVAPVLQLPVNVAKFGYQMSPVSWPELVYRISKGEEIPDAKLGRAVMGGALWYWVFGQVAAGKITGSGPIDPVEKQRLKSSGWQPHSFHAANGKFYPLYWAGPIGESISMAADTAEIYRDAPRAATGLDLASMVAAHAGRFILDQPYMQGLADVVKAMEDTNWAPFMVGSTIGGFIPSIVARTGAAMDPEQRKLSGMIDVVKSRVPYYREELPPKRDIRGRPLPAPGTPADRFLNPMAASQQTAVSPPELVAATAKIPQVQGFIRYKGKNLTLDAVDRDRYEELAGQIVDRRFTAIEKAPSRFTAKTDEEQLRQVRDIITGARDEARMKLISELKKRGTLAAMQEAEMGKAGAHAQANPYADTLAVPGADKAEGVLDRYQIKPKGLPSNVPEDLADEFERQLAIDRAKFFFRVYTTPEELGVQPFDSAQAQVQQLEDIARKHAADTVLRRAGMLKAKQ